MNNTPIDREEAINREYQYRLTHPIYKSKNITDKYKQRTVPIRTIGGIQNVQVSNKGSIKQGGSTHTKLYNYSNKNRNHPIKGIYAREVDSWNNNTSPFKGLANSGIGYAIVPEAQAIYDYTNSAINISNNRASIGDYLGFLPVIGTSAKGTLKRGVEVLMRTSNDANPIEDIVYHFNKANPKKKFGVTSYISTGIGYNTLAPEAYTGFQKAAKGNDMIDAFLYSKTINPSYNVKKVDYDYGPHSDYIRTTYPYKDIPVYENTSTIDFFTNKPKKSATNITSTFDWKGANNNLDFGNNGVDAAGHLVQEGTSNGKQIYRAQDIWKFNPNEYKKKWNSFELDKKAILGLKLLDYLGTPIIVRTPWLYR